MSAEPNKQLALVEPSDLNPYQLISIAVSRGIAPDELKQLMELQREWKADQAREAFLAAMNAFRSKSLQIFKTKRVEFGNTKYKHATLANIVDIIAPALSEHGLSHRWETKQDGSGITVKCIITHALGHSVETALTAAPDQSGGKNSIQAIGSTVTYLQRYSLLALTGLAAQDQDDDGAALPGGATITSEQATELQRLMDEIGIIGPRKDKMYEVWKITKLQDIAAKDFDACRKIIEGKRKA